MLSRSDLDIMWSESDFGKHVVDGQTLLAAQIALYFGVERHEISDAEKSGLRKLRSSEQAMEILAQYLQWRNERNSEEE